MADFDRPLNGRGRLAAPFMGELIARENIMPDLIVSSPAKRAIETAELVKENAGLNAEIRFDERIYEATTETLRQVISSIDDSVETVMLVGHNPGFEGILNYLIGKAVSMPTAAMAVIELEIDSWSDLNPSTGTLSRIYRPKDEMRHSA
ncbi:histidine phosphatase family protein [soil metagenome]